MAAVSRISLTLPVLLVGLVLGLLGVVCHGGVIQHGDSNQSRQHLDSSGDRALQVAGQLTKAGSESPAKRRWKTLARRLNTIRHATRPGRATDENLPLQSNPSTAKKRRAIREGDQHERDVSQSSPARHWRRLSRRLNTVLSLMRSRKPVSTSSGVHSNRVRRSRDPQDVLAQQQAIADDVHQIEDEAGPRHQLAQQEIAREVEQGERDAGKPSDAQKLAQEEEIAREVAQIEEQYGPAHKIAQQKEIAREIEEAEINAGRAEADRRFEQQREIEREIEEVERRAGLPSDAKKLDMEREIAREIQQIEAAAKKRQDAQVRTVADDIRAIVAAHLRHHHRLISSLADDASSLGESKESNEDTNEVTEEDEDEVDVDPIYDDAFDNSDLVSPFDENGDDDDISSFFSSDKTAADPDVPSGAQGQVKDAPTGEDHSKTAHSSWQVTLMTVIVCSIVGIVLLIVVGAWYRDIGFRPLLPGKPEHLILDDDEQTVYNGTTQSEPRQVGTYSPLT